MSIYIYKYIQDGKLPTKAVTEQCVTVFKANKCPHCQIGHKNAGFHFTSLQTPYYNIYQKYMGI